MTKGVVANFLHHALRYAELGYHVFPCTPNDKRPLPGSNGLLEASTDPEKIERWWAEHPSSNIALQTEHLLVVDVDGPDNPWLQDQPEKLAELMAAPMQITPRGGRHYVFRQPEGIECRNTASKIAPMVDTRASGGYILVAPSSVNGKQYHWVDGMSLDMSPDKLPSPPGWLLALLEEKYNDRKTNCTDEVKRPTSASEGGRNNLLTSLGGALRRSGLSQAEILAALRAANVERCSPPLGDKEVETIAWSVSRYEPDQVATIIAEGEGSVICGPETTEADEIHDDPGQLPDSLLSVPGFINDVINYTLECAPYPEKVLAFNGALALQAFLASRKVRDESNNRTSLYILGLANSGVGKEFPRKVNQRILLDAGLIGSLADSISSAEGLEDRLYSNPSVLMQTDEFDSLLIAIRNGKDTRYEMILSALLKFFTSADGIYTMRVKANTPADFINQPGLTLYGTTIPKQFYEALSPRLLTNGFMSRTLVFESGPRGKGQDSIIKDIPENIKSVAQWWANFTPGLKNNNLASWNPDPKIVKRNEEAQALSQQYKDQFDHEYKKCEIKKDNIGMTIWNRTFEKMCRLALIYAVSESYELPQIKKETIQWAGELAKHQTKRLLFMANCYVSEGGFEARCKRLLEVLREWKSQNSTEWMPHSQVARKLRNWSRKDHEETRQALIDQGMIQSETKISGGRPAVMIRLSTPVLIA